MAGVKFNPQRSPLPPYTSSWSADDQGRVLACSLPVTVMLLMSLTDLSITEDEPAIAPTCLRSILTSTPQITAVAGTENKKVWTHRSLVFTVPLVGTVWPEVVR